MMLFAYGGAASGKSEFAEYVMTRLPGDRVYVATMDVYDAESRARIEKHQTRREYLHAQTVVLPHAVDETCIKACLGESVLFECLGTHVANVLYNAPSEDSEEGAASLSEPGKTFCQAKKQAQAQAQIHAQTQPQLQLEKQAQVRAAECEIANQITEDLLHLQHVSKNMVIVGNDVFSSGESYLPEMYRYLRILAQVSSNIAGYADGVVEVVCGIPVVHAGSSYVSQLVQEVSYAWGGPTPNFVTPASVPQQSNTRVKEALL